MKTSFLTFILTACSLFLSAQAIDSVSAILIKYDVHLDIKESLAALMDEPSLKEFYYIFKDNVVFVKEVNSDGTDNGVFRCYDTDRKHQYRCTVKEDRISAIPMPNYINQSRTIPHHNSDSVQIIEGYPCKPINVLIDGVVHEVWYTDVFGTQFSTITDLPGIPLYYEKTNPIDGKLKFRAIDVRPIKVPAFYFDIDNYELLEDEWLSGRKVYTTAEKFPLISKKLLDGQKISSKDSIGKVMFYTFWQPEYNNLRGDIHALNILQKEFAADEVIFVALNTLSRSSALKHRIVSEFDFLHIPNSDHLFNFFGIGIFPNHFIVDKRGYIRYRYTGIFGKPLLTSLRRDLEFILPSKNKNAQ